MYSEDGGTYLLAAQEQPQLSPRRSTITERLELEEKRLNKRLAEIKVALVALRKNPDMQAVIDIIAKTL